MATTIDIYIATTREQTTSLIRKCVVRFKTINAEKEIERWQEEEETLPACSLEGLNSIDECADPELDRIGSDIEEGGRNVCGLIPHQTQREPLCRENNKRGAGLRITESRNQLRFHSNGTNSGSRAGECRFCGCSKLEVSRCANKHLGYIYMDLVHSFKLN